MLPCNCSHLFFSDAKKKRITLPSIVRAELGLEVLMGRLTRIVSEVLRNRKSELEHDNLATILMPITIIAL